jgi:signal transduction histidine kinase
VDLCEEPDLPIKTKEAIYRITQESLNNIAKHAGAQNAFVALTSTAEQIMLTVRDDGAGFNPTEEFPGHFGLQSMRERARRIAGRYEIASAPGKGATVTLTIPLAHGQHR